MSRPRPPHKLDPRRALLRLALAAGVAVAAGFVLAPLFDSDIVAVLGGWDAGGATIAALSWWTIARANAIRTQVRAASEDPGRTAVYAIIVLTSLVSLVAAVVLSRRASVVAPGETHELVALSLAAVALSWMLTHLAFTLRYAHLYYREDDEGIGGVEFPGGARPTYFDFAYFAFTIGMCFQVSDATITSAQIRRTVLLQAVLSFFYNTAIVAFVLNLVFAMAG